MKQIVSSISIFFLLFLTSTIFAQTENVQQIPAIKEGIRENYSQSDYKNFLLREKRGEIPFQGGLVDQQAAADALVNNNTGSTGTSNFTQSETSIIAFGSNVLIGFNDSGSFTGGANKFTGYSYSTDGGTTFIDGGTLPTSAVGDAGDPVIARNETTGRIYFSTLGFSGASTIQVFRSDNNGLTYLAPVNGTPGGSSEDKQWIAVDNFAGPGNGNVYLISRRFGGTPGIYFFRSIDNGNTFTPSGGVNLFSGGQGAFVAVGPDHSVYTFRYDGTSTIQMRKSIDQGVTFGATVTVASGLVGGINGDLGLTGLRQGTATFSGFRSNEFPHAAVNPVSGHIYVTYDNDAPGGDKADVFMTMSTDGGATWSASTRVNDDATTTDQWQPTIAVTPNGNNIGIFYYSRQEDPGSNNLFKYYGRTGTISGSTVTFSPSFAISDVGSLPEFGRDAVVNSVYMGDYNHASVTASPTAFHVVWSDNRNDLPGGAPRKDPNVYYENIPIAQSQFLVWEGVLGGQDYSGAYINSFLSGLAYTVDYTSTFPSSLIGYDAVFLSFGNFPNNVAFDATMASIVQTYLVAGGRVYLEGGDALEFNQSVNVPLHDLFGLGDGSDGGTNIIDGLQGQVGSLTEGMLFTSSSQVGNNWIDIYVPTTGTLAFDESSYGNVGVQYSGSFSQRTFCFSYALADLTDASFPSTKNELMTRILNFLVGPTALPPDISINPSSFTFDVPEGGSDSDVLTINNLGQQNLVWNVFEEEVPPLAGIKLKLDDGRELPVTIQPKFDWNQPVKGEDYTPLTPSTGKPPTDVFIKTLYKNPEIRNSLLFGTDAYGTEGVIGNYTQFDLGVPEVLNAISSFTDFIPAGDFGVDLTFAYAVNTTTNEFIRINKTTGAITVVGPCVPTQNPPSEVFSGMAIDPNSGIVYLSSTDITTSWLYTVNTTTGAPTLVGILTNAPAMIAIAINNSGQMYGYEIIGDVMLIVDKSNGVGTVLGPIGFDANFAQGLDFDPITGTLYLSAFNNSTFQAELRTGNTTTGATTLVGVLGSTTPGSLVDVTWIGLPGEFFDCTWLAESPVSGSVPGGGSQNVDIFVDATGLTAGTYNCNLIITSNDPTTPQVTVPVTLNVTAPPPDINATPTALTFVVPVGGNETDILTIENTALAGSQDLIWNISEQEVILFSLEGIEIPISINMGTNYIQSHPIGKNQNIINQQASSISSDEKYSAGHEPRIIGNKNNQNFLIEREQATLTVNSVLLISSGGSPSDIQSYLISYIPIVDIFDALIGTPTLGQLSAYEAVIVMNDNAFFDPIALGNVLADYIDVGGGVVTTTASFATGFDLQGRFITDGYSPFISGPGPLPGTNLGTYDPTHPIMGGITTFFGDLLVDPSLESGANLIASYDNGFECVATKGRVAALNIFVVTPGFWTGDVPLLLANAANFVGGTTADVPWITENPLNGTIPAGSSQNVDVTVDATGLTGGTYNCNLVITSNDPDENPVVVPVTLIVTSGPPPENFALVTNTDDNNFHIIDVATNTIVGPFLSGSLGGGILLDPVITPDGQTALITSFIDQTVFFVDVSNPYSPSISGSVNVGFFAEDIDLTPDGAFALVTDGNATTLIAVIDVSAMSLIQTLDITTREAQAVAIGPDGTVLVADYANSQIHVLLLNLSTGLLTDLATAIAVGLGPANVAISPDGQTALVANINSTSVDVLQIIAPGSVTLTGSVPNILNVQSIAFETNGTRAFALQTGPTPDELAVLSVTSPGNVIDTGVRVSLISDASAGGGLFGVDVIDVSADGIWAYVGNPSTGLINNDVAVVDLNSYTLSTSLAAGNYPTGIAVGGAAAFAFTVKVTNGWNMVSVPGINPAGMGVTTWWSGKDPAADVFKYSWWLCSSNYYNTIQKATG